MDDRQKAPSLAPRRDKAATESSYNAGLSTFTYIIGGIVAWSLIGWWVGSLLNSPWIILIGVAVGLVGGFYLTNHHGYFRRQDSGSQNNTGEQD